MSAMATSEPPESGTLLIAALLLLGLAFAGVWIVANAGTEGEPWPVVPWFLGAAAVIVGVGLAVIIGRARRSGGG